MNTKELIKLQKHLYHKAFKLYLLNEITTGTSFKLTKLLFDYAYNYKNNFLGFRYDEPTEVYLVNIKSAFDFEFAEVSLSKELMELSIVEFEEYFEKALVERKEKHNFTELK